VATPLGTFRSGLEVKFALLLHDNNLPIVYERSILKFNQPEKKRSYKVDFDLGSFSIEVKGRLTVQDRQKMLWVKQQNPEAKIVFVFDNKNKKLDKRSKLTHGTWADKHGFLNFDLKELIECPQKLKSLKSL
jgi:Phage endonuclease I